MCCAPSSTALALCAALLAGAVQAQDCPPAPSAGPQGFAELLLSVDTGPGGSETLLSVLHDPDGRFWLDRATLASWRLPLPPQPARQYAGQGWDALDTIAGLVYDYQGCSQSLQLDFSRVSRGLLQYSFKPSATALAGPASPGAYGNFDLQLTRARAHEAVDLLSELGVFGPYGRGLQSLVLGSGRRLRLDSTWYFEQPAKLRTLALGDSISHGGSWGRPLRFGGLRWASDFSLQPHFVTYPQPSLRGAAALPSTLEVFINDSLRGRQQVEGGAFELQDVPALTGGGEAQIIVRDVLGRESLLTQSFYISPALLLEGLAEFSVDVGWERGGYGLVSADYGSMFGAVTHRLGLSDRLTRELRVELAHDALALGASGVWLPARIGVLTATAAFGVGEHDFGAMAAFGFERDIAGRYGIGFRSQWAQADFWQLGLDERAPPRRSDNARISALLHRGGTLALAYAAEDRRDGADLRLFTASYITRIGGGWHFTLSASDARADAQHRSLSATLSRAFSGHYAGSAQADLREGQRAATRASLQRGMAGPLDWGYRAEVQQGLQARQELRGEWGLPLGQLSGVAVHEAQAGTSLRAGARTALVFLDRTGYLTRPLQGSFAVVRVADLADVPVYADNRLVARTGARGTALVPELRPYERNVISVRPEDLPIERSLEALSREVTPRRRSGVSVMLGEEDWIGMEVVLRNEAGVPVPPGAEVRELATAELFPVGTAGRVFVRQHAGRHHLWVKAKGWDCIAAVELQQRRPDQAPATALCKAQP